MKRNQKGFTLAELLIVVAIIAVLAAIAIPIFTSQLEKSRESTDLSSIRGYYAEISTGLLTGDLKKATNTITVGKNLTATLKSDVPTTAGSSFSVELTGVSLKQTMVDWQTKSYEVAGVTDITGIETTLPTADNATVTFTFVLATDGDYYLNAVSIA